MTTLEERISNLEGSFGQLDKRVGDLTESVNQLRADMNSKFNTLIIVMATGGVAVAGAIVTLAFRG